MQRIGRKLLDERRAAILTEIVGGADAVEKKSMSGKDIFSVMSESAAVGLANMFFRH